MTTMPRTHPGGPTCEAQAPGGTWVSPATGRLLAWNPLTGVFATPDADERFACLAGEIPDFRIAAAPLAGAEIEALRARLAEWWTRSEAEPVPPQTLRVASRRDERRYRRLIARAEIGEFVRWCARGRRPGTQRDSMERYRTVADVYPNALRRQIWVLAGGRPASASILLFKRLSLEPIVDLIRTERLRSVLDFGCGWGANTILLNQLLPGVDVWSFDYSPERVLAAEFNLRRLGLAPHRLFVADGSRLPLPDDSVDLVLTTHVLEQMGEVLPRALAEVRRVARRFACHIEPTYRWARWPHRLRMRRLGYPRDIAERSVSLGWELLAHRPASPAWGRNPGELIVLRK